MATANMTQNMSGAVGAPGVLVPNMDPRLNLPWSAGANANMMSVYGTPINTGLDSNYMQAANSITLSDMLSSDVSRSGFFVMTGFAAAEQRGKWIFAAAKPRRRTNMHHVIQILESRATMMAKAPEGTAPPLVQIAESSRVSSMERFHQGAKEFWDVLMTPNGLAAWKFKLATMVRSAWITAHTVILTAFLSVPDYYQNYFKKHGTSYATVADSLLVPTTVFAALNMNSHGIYDVTTWVLGLMNKKPNMAVVAANTIAYITKNKNFETDASRRGLEAATNNLIQGDGVRNMLTSVGIQLFEDNPTNVDNVSPYKNDLLRMNFCFGRCFVLDDSIKIFHHDKSLDVKAMYSPGTASMDKDGYKRWKPEDLIKHCHVWTSNLLDYSASMKEYLAEIQNIQSTGGNPGALPSPYFYHVGANPAAAGSGDAYKKHGGLDFARVLGDQAPEVRGTEKDLEHARSAHAWLRKKLKDRPDETLGDYDRFFEQLDELYNAPSLNASVIGMVNGVVVANMQQGKSLVEADPLTGAPKILPVPNANKQLSYKDAAGVEHVLVRFDMDDEPTFRLTTGNLAAGGIVGVVDANNEVNFALGDKLVDVDTPGMYLWVPLANLAAVQAAVRPGKANQAYAAVPRIPPALPFLDTTAAKVAAALRRENVDVTAANAINQAAANTISNKYYLRGFKPQSGKVVMAPSLPYGWATIAHAFRLVDLKRSGEAIYGDAINDGAIKRMYKRLEKGRDAFEKIYTLLSGLYKYSEINETYCPSYIATGMADIDKRYAFAFTRDSNKLPLFSIAPARIKGVTESATAVGVVTADVVESIDDVAGLATVHRQTLDDAAIVALLQAAGYTNAEARALIGAANPGFEAFFSNLTSSEFMEPTVAETLRDPAQYGRLFEFFRTTELGSSLNTSLRNRPNTGVAPGDRNFKQFIQFVIVPALQKGEAEVAQAMFANVYSLTATSYEQRKVVRKLDEGYLQKISNLKASRKHTFDADITGAQLRVGAAAAIPSTNRDLWVNSRLTLNPILFQRLEQIVTSKAAGPTDAIAYASIPVRPANPANPNGPLFTYLLNVGTLGAGGAGGPAIANAVRTTANTAISSFKDARISPGVTHRGNFSRFTFSSSRNFAPLLAHSSSMTHKYARVDTDTAALNKKVASVSQSPFGPAAVHMPHSRLPVTENPQYGYVQYEDERGRELPELSIWAKKNNLIFRVNAIHDTNVDDIEKQCAMLFNFSRCCGATDLRFLEEDVLMANSTFIIAQPCIQVVTTPILYIASGEQTAEFGYNWDHNAISYDNEHKKVMAHITIWMACDVIDPTAYFAAKHAKVEQYVRGMDNSILANTAAYDPQKAFRNDPMRGLGSCIIMSVGANYTRDRQLSENNPLPLNGKHLSKMLPFTYMNPSSVFGPGSSDVPGHSYYRWLFDFDQVFESQHVDDSSYMTTRRYTTVNGELFHGKMNYYDESGHICHTVDGTGYMKNLDPPFRPILTGQIQGNVWKD